MQHARAVLVGAESSARLREIERTMQSVTIGAGAAEAAYSDWKQTKLRRTSRLIDERVRIDYLPTFDELQAWCRDGKGNVGGDWVQALSTAVTVDLVPVTGDNDRSPGLTLKPLSRVDVLDYRPPRPAIVRVWKLTASTSEVKYDKELVEITRLLVTYPGNETTVAFRGDGASRAMTASFDDVGALVKLTSSDIDPGLQRAHDISAMLPAVSAAAQSGHDLLNALAPPSLTERAAELDAARKLRDRADSARPQPGAEG